jgi:hypothetical protein
VVPPYALPRVHKNLGYLALRGSTSTRVSAPRRFLTWRPFVPPVFHSHSAMAYTTPAVRISLSRNLTTPVLKFSNLFLRVPETRSLAQIQRSSCATDPTTILLSLPRDLETWSTQMLNSHPVSFRACEIR